MDISRINGFLKSGYPYFYALSNQLSLDIQELKEIADCKVKVWDFIESQDPEEVLEVLDQSEVGTLVVAKNLNWFLSSQGEINPVLVQTLQSKIDQYSSREYRKSLLILSNQDFASAIPDELQRDFISLEFTLPDIEAIEQQVDKIIDSVKENPKFEMPNASLKKQCIESAKGMTTREVSNAFALMLVENKGKFNASTISELRDKGIEAVPGVKVLESNEDFSNVVGLDLIKEVSKAVVGHPLGKGLMLLGPPGTGKTLFASCLGKEIGMKVYSAELAEMFGEGLVGQAENAVKAFCDFIKAASPCICFIDEIEKGLSGMRNQQGDTTGKRSMSQLLKLLSDRPEGLYFIATCNDIQGLPPEWLRAERWDQIFFIDLPNETERKAISEYYRKHYKALGYKIKGTLKDSDGYSGAEIKTAHRLAAMMDKPLNEVQKLVIPVSKTMNKQIEALRNWAKDRTIPASGFSNATKKKAGKRNIDL